MILMAGGFCKLCPSCTAVKHQSTSKPTGQHLLAQPKPHSEQQQLCLLQKKRKSC